MLLLIAVSYVIFDFSPDLGALLRYIPGIFLIFTIYSLIGLSISLWGLRDSTAWAIALLLVFVYI